MTDTDFEAWAGEWLKALEHEDLVIAAHNDSVYVSLKGTMLVAATLERTIPLV